MRASIVAALCAANVLCAAPAPAAQGECRRSVVFTLPGVTWSEVRRVQPPAILDAARRGAVGSVSVRVGSGQTTYASGFATIGAGNRVDASSVTSALVSGASSGDVEAGTKVRVDGLDALLKVTAGAGYGARPGAMASSLAPRDVAAVGNGSAGAPEDGSGYGAWTQLAAMDTSGIVDVSYTSDALLMPAEGWPYGVRTDPETVVTATERALSDGCASLVVDQGDLMRADRAVGPSEDPRSPARRSALLAADDLLGSIDDALTSDDLLLIVSPTSPGWDERTHLGVAIARGPGYAAGSSLSSATTRQAGTVNLSDVAPTVLAHAGRRRPGSMLGRPWFAVDGEGERIARAIDLDAESVLMLSAQPEIVLWFVVLMVLASLAALAVCAAARRRGARPPAWVESAMLAVVCFPVATYLANFAQAHRLGLAAFLALVAVIDVAVVAGARLLLREPLLRLLAVFGMTLAFMALDQLLLGGSLQLNAVFGNFPTFGGRFAGLGNTAFAILGCSAILAGALIVHRWGRGRRPLVAVAILFACVLVLDGAPQLGSDVGGVITLVPALAITFLLLSGRKLGWRLILAALGAGVLVLVLIVAADLLLPAESRTHLARLLETVQSEGWGVLFDTAARKLRANVGVFSLSIWAYFVPPLLVGIGLYLFRGRSASRRLRAHTPRLLDGFAGVLLLGLLGFALNDSGIVIPAMTLILLVPSIILAEVEGMRAETT